MQFLVDGGPRWSKPHLGPNLPGFTPSIWTYSHGPPHCHIRDLLALSFGRSTYFVVAGPFLTHQPSWYMKSRQPIYNCWGLPLAPHCQHSQSYTVCDIPSRCGVTTHPRPQSLNFALLLPSIILLRRHTCLVTFSCAKHLGFSVDFFQILFPIFCFDLLGLKLIFRVLISFFGS